MNVPSYPSLCQMSPWASITMSLSWTPCQICSVSQIKQTNSKFHASLSLIWLGWTGFLVQIYILDWIVFMKVKNSKSRYLCFHSFFFNFWFTSDGFSAFDVLGFLRYSTLDKWETIKGQLKVIWSAFNKFQIVKDNYIYPELQLQPHHTRVSFSILLSIKQWPTILHNFDSNLVRVTWTPELGTFSGADIFTHCS